MRRDKAHPIFCKATDMPKLSPQPQLKPLLVLRARAQDVLGIGRNKYWALVKSGDLEVINKRWVTFESIENYVARQRHAASIERGTSVPLRKPHARAAANATRANT